MSVFYFMTFRNLMLIAPSFPFDQRILAIGAGEPMDVMIPPTFSTPKCLLCFTKSPTFILAPNRCSNKKAPFRFAAHQRS